MIAFSVYRNEFRDSLYWHIAWIAVLASIILMTILIYPGEKALQSFMPLLQEEYFQAFFGNIGGAPPNYTLWLSLLFPFVVLILFLYGITTGIRVAVQSISDNTGELVHTLPVPRYYYLLIRLLVAISAIIIYFILQFLLLSVPVLGEVIEYDKLVTVTWWGILYGISGLGIGMVLGLLAGNSIRGYQLSIFVVMLLYALQLFARIRPEIAELNNLNPIALYQPESIFLFDSLKEGFFFDISYPLYPIYIVILLMLFIPFAFIEFNRKDLSDDAGISFNVIKRMSLRRSEGKSNGIWGLLFLTVNPFYKILSIFKNKAFPQQKRNNFFVFWARIFEKKYPFTADFIYSDVITIVLAILAILMFFPLQLILYPGDQLIQDTISGFGSSPIILIFTYGYNLVSEPYLWFVISQSIGISWMILLPLSFFWIRKAIRSDGNTGTGEILGSLPTKPQTVIYQRLLAIIIELLALILLMVFWLVVSELISGESYDQIWEIVAIISAFPLYWFLITFSMILANVFKEKGGVLVAIFLIGTILLFILSLLSEPLNTWYIRGIFGLYDPVLIIQERSLFPNNNKYGILILSLMAVASTIGLILTASKYTWLNISEKANLPKN